MAARPAESLGIGVGFRPPHYRRIVQERPDVDWFEVLSENFMVDGGSPLHWLDGLVAHYPVALHGVSMSLGSDETEEHTRRLLQLVERTAPHWVSDHLCFTRAGGVDVHDLLPLPFHPDVRDHVVERIRRIQDRLAVPFAVENVSSYLTHTDSVMPEWAFVAEIAEAADCALLLDVNNVYVSACNHGFDPVDYLDGLPLERVIQVHLAGHSIRDDGMRIDTHDGPVCDEVLALYQELVRRTGPVSTLLEWDSSLPTLEGLLAEAERIREALHAA